MFKAKRLMVVLMLAGCATARPGPAVPSGVTRGGAVGTVLSMQVQWLSADGQKMEMLPVGHALPHGARYAVKAKAGAKAYLYLIELGEGGLVRKVHQGANAPVLAKSGFEVNLPAGGGWLSQAPQQGKSQLVLLASPAKLTETDVLNGAQLPSSPDATAKRDPPPESLPEGKRGDVVEVVQTGAGVTVARFEVGADAS